MLLKYFLLSCSLYSCIPPRGKWMDYSLGDYADNSFAALGSSDPREVMLELELGFYVFHFRFSSPFCFLLTEFVYTFFMFYKILPYYVY